MLQRILVGAVLATSLAATGLCAQPASAPGSAPEANPVDPAAVQALKDMGAYLQTLKRFQVSTDLTAERVLADGQKLQHTAAAELQVERPNKLRVTMRSSRSERELIYDGKVGHALHPGAEVLLDGGIQRARWASWSIG